MNVYAIAPLIAAIAYIPILVTTISSRPWQRRHQLFLLFLIPAMLWNLSDFFFRGNILPDYHIIIWEITFLLFPLMAVQFHCFTSSFFSTGNGRWLPFAYGSLAGMVILHAP